MQPDSVSITRTLSLAQQRKDSQRVGDQVHFEPEVLIKPFDGKSRFQ